MSSRASLCALLCASLVAVGSAWMSSPHQQPYNQRSGASLAQLVAHITHTAPQGPPQPAHDAPTEAPGVSIVNSGPCVAEVGGLQWDLSSLTGHDVLFKEKYKAYDFSLAVCGISSKNCGPKLRPTQASMCQHHGLWSYTLIDKWESPKWNLLDGSDPRKGVQASFHNGDAIGCGRSRLTTVQFVCDASAATPTILSVTEPSACNYIVSLHSDKVCHGGSNHLSHSSSFLVMLLTIFIIYCAIGVAYKRNKLGVTDWKESIPNVDFWVEVPGHLKDGAVWVKDKVQAAVAAQGGAPSSSSGATAGGVDAHADVKYQPV